MTQPQHPWTFWWSETYQHYILHHGDIYSIYRPTEIARMIEAFRYHAILFPEVTSGLDESLPENVRKAMLVHTNVRRKEPYNPLDINLEDLGL